MVIGKSMKEIIFAADTAVSMDDRSMAGCSSPLTTLSLQAAVVRIAMTTRLWLVARATI
jgi:hypothetical protein